MIHALPARAVNKNPKDAGTDCNLCPPNFQLILHLASIAEEKKRRSGIAKLANRKDLLILEVFMKSIPFSVYFINNKLTNNSFNFAFISVY